MGKMTLLSLGEIPTQQEQAEEGVGVTLFFCFFLNIFFIQMTELSVRAGEVSFSI